MNKLSQEINQAFAYGRHSEVFEKLSLKAKLENDAINVYDGNRLVIVAKDKESASRHAIIRHNYALKFNTHLTVAKSFSSKALKHIDVIAIEKDGRFIVPSTMSADANNVSIRHIDMQASMTHIDNTKEARAVFTAINKNSRESEFGFAMFLSECKALWQGKGLIRCGMILADSGMLVILAKDFYTANVNLFLFKFDGKDIKKNVIASKMANILVAKYRSQCELAHNVCTARHKEAKEAFCNGITEVLELINKKNK